MCFRARPFALAALSIVPILSVAAAEQLTICPILGQQWPTPRNLWQEPTFQAAAWHLTTTSQGLQNTADFNVTSYSAVVFSGSDDSRIFDYHHTDQAIWENSVGTKKVTADTVYRLASVSKVLTLYISLAQVGKGPLSDLVAKWVSELLKSSDVEELDVARHD